MHRPQELCDQGDISLCITYAQPSSLLALSKLTNVLKLSVLTWEGKKKEEELGLPMEKLLDNSCKEPITINQHFICILKNHM